MSVIENPAAAAGAVATMRRVVGPRTEGILAGANAAASPADCTTCICAHARARKHSTHARTRKNTRLRMSMPPGVRVA
jgi:hypothetical protein